MEQFLWAVKTGTSVLMQAEFIGLQMRSGMLGHAKAEGTNPQISSGDLPNVKSGVAAGISATAADSSVRKGTPLHYAADFGQGTLPQGSEKAHFCQIETCGR